MTVFQPLRYLTRSLLLAAIVALAAPYEALAAPLWAISGCTALDPYTAAAPTNATLTVTVNNVSAFAQRGAGCVIRGAVSLVFNVEAMRAVALASGAPNVSIAVSDVALWSIGAAFPSFSVEVADSDASSTDVLPLDMMIHNMTLRADFCTVSTPGVVEFAYSSRLPPASRIQLRDLHVQAVDCVNVTASQLQFTALTMFGVTLRGATTLEVSNVTVTLDKSPPLGAEVYIFLGEINTEAGSTGAVLISDVAISVKGGILEEGALYAVYLEELHCLGTCVTIQNPRLLFQSAACETLQATVLRVTIMELDAAAHLVVHGAEITIRDATSGRIVGVRGIYFDESAAVGGSAVLEVILPLFVIANVTMSSTTPGGLLMYAVTLGSEFKVSGNASVAITGSARLPPLTLVEGRGAVASGVEVRDVRLVGGSKICFVSLVEAEAVSIEGQASVAVEGAEVRLDTVQLNSTLTGTARVYATLLRGFGLASIALARAESRLTLRRSRVVVARTAANTITTGAVVMEGQLNVSGAAAITNVGLVTHNVTVHGTDGAQSYAVWVERGVLVGGSGAVLTVNDTCHLVDAVLPAGAIVSSTVFGPPRARTAVLSLTSGGRFDSSGNDIVCRPFSPTLSASLSATAPLPRTATVVPPPPTTESALTTAGSAPPTSPQWSPATTSATSATSATSESSQGSPATSNPPATTADPTTTTQNPSQTPSASSGPASTTPTTAGGSGPLSTPASTQAGSHPASQTNTAATSVTAQATTSSLADDVGQRGNGAQEAAANTLADRPGALAALIVCLVAGVGAAGAAVAVWRWRQIRQQKDQTQLLVAEDEMSAVPIRLPNV